MARPRNFNVPNPQNPAQTRSIPRGLSSGPPDAFERAVTRGPGANTFGPVESQQQVSGGGGQEPAASAIDLSTYLSYFGLPPNVIADINRLFGSDPDPNRAVQAAIAYIRGTDWYKQTFPGIQEGIARGILGNEADYRSYKNSLDQIYQRYYGRAATTGEIQAALNRGVTTEIVAREQEGRAIANVYGSDFQYLLGNLSNVQPGGVSGSDLVAIGEQRAGLSSPLGLRLSKALEEAQQRLGRLFQGESAAPSLSLAGGNIQAPSLLGGVNPTDVGR